MKLRTILEIGGIVMGGIAIGRHFGVVDGIAAALVIYAMMPEQDMMPEQTVVVR